MNRISCLSTGMALAGIIAPCSNAKIPVGKTKPNIVLILADDMGYGDVGFTGCQDIPALAIDSIAANVPIPWEQGLDGINLLPALLGDKTPENI